MSKEEKKVTLELTQTELFQIMLSVGYRVSGVGQQMVNETDKDREKALTDMANYLTGLHVKITKVFQESMKEKTDVESPREEKN